MNKLKRIVKLRDKAVREFEMQYNLPVVDYSFNYTFNYNSTNCLIRMIRFHLPFGCERVCRIKNPDFNIDRLVKLRTQQCIYTTPAERLFHVRKPSNLIMLLNKMAKEIAKYEDP